MMEEFIVKNHRKYFKAKCIACGSDRGFKTKNQLNKKCYSCHGKNANKASLKVRSGKVCSVDGCLQKHGALGFCDYHYDKHRRPSTQGMKYNCALCGGSFNRSGAQIYCSETCNSKAYRLRNHAAIQLRYKKLNRKAYRRVYARLNREKLSHDVKERRRTDLNFRVASNLRARLSRAVRKNTKSVSAVKDLGCSIKHLRIKLQLKFHRHPADGHYMSWDNYGEWHIDHIIPLSSFDFSNQESSKVACHYSNLQPLWARDNLRKSDK